MLGIIGFLVLAAVMVAFALVTLKVLKPVYNWERLLSFTGAFFVLAATSLVWAGAVMIGTDTPQFVFMSDVLLIIATGLVLDSLLDLRKRPPLLVLVSLIGAIALTFRAFNEPSTAFVSEGLLHFDLTQTEAVIIGLAFLLTWLPAGTRLFHVGIARIQRFAYLRQTIVFLYSGTILMTCYFLAASRPIIIVASFIGICVLFAATAGSLYVMTKKEVRKSRA